MLERWREDAATPQPAALLDQLARYLRFRMETFPAADEEGASLDELRQMARRNAGLELPPAAPPRRVHVDGRLHAWEWLQLPGGRVLKTDAVDHSNAHDLIGCQDIAWDIAGAQVELGANGRALCEATGTDPASLDFYVPAYCAFQIGLWTYAGDIAEVARYKQAAQG